jgi:RNA polymerase sigma-70 factor (ECF subfamily)
MPQPALTPATFDAAFQRHAAALRAYFRRRTGGAPDVDDLVQEVFVRLLKREPQDFIENLAGYIFQIAANLLRERARTRARQSGIGTPYLSAGTLEGDEDFSAERVELARDAFDQLEMALRELPERVRTVFVLNRFEEWTAIQISRHLGVSVSTVEKDMVRAIGYSKERLR